MDFNYRARRQEPKSRLLKPSRDTSWTSTWSRGGTWLSVTSALVRPQHRPSRLIALRVQSNSTHTHINTSNTRKECCQTSIATNKLSLEMINGTKNRYTGNTHHSSTGLPSGSSRAKHIFIAVVCPQMIRSRSVHLLANSDNWSLIIARFRRNSDTQWTDLELQLSLSLKFTCGLLVDIQQFSIQVINITINNFAVASCVKHL